MVSTAIPIPYFRILRPLETGSKERFHILCHAVLGLVCALQSLLAAAGFSDRSAMQRAK